MRKALSKGSIRVLTGRKAEAKTVRPRNLRLFSF